MSRSLKLLPLLAGVVAIVITAAACGSSDDESASDTTTAAATTASSSETATWANSVCGAFVTWRTQVVSAGKSVAANPTTAQVNQALANARTATTTLKTTLQGLDTPSTKAADQARTELQQLQGQLQNDAAVIKRTITSSTGDASERASTVKTGLLTMQSQLKATGKELRSLPSGEVAQAFADAPACQSL